jgi:hypothetical protein
VAAHCWGEDLRASEIEGAADLAQGRGASIRASEDEVVAHCWGEDLRALRAWPIWRRGADLPSAADLRAQRIWICRHADLLLRLCSAAAARTAAGTAGAGRGIAGGARDGRTKQLWTRGFAGAAAVLGCGREDGCRCFGSDRTPGVALQGVFRSRTMLPTVAQWFVLGARETVNNDVQVRAA